MATQKQRADATRGLLLKAFRDAFITRGYEKTAVQQVLTEIGLSKGAMYHHFRSKIEVVEALYEEESRGAIVRAFRKVDADGSALARLKEACLAWTKEVRTPTVSKILFEIGPTALGPQRAKEIEDTISLRHIEALLDQAIADGDLISSDPKLIAAFLNALVAEATLYSLRTKKRSFDALGDAIDGLLGAFRP